MAQLSIPTIIALDMGPTGGQQGSSGTMIIVGAVAENTSLVPKMGRCGPRGYCVISLSSPRHRTVLAIWSAHQLCRAVLSLRR